MMTEVEKMMVLMKIVLVKKDVDDGASEDGDTEDFVEFVD